MSILKRIFKPRPAVVELWLADNEKWYFHLKASNGKVVSPSQGYTTKSNAVRAARKLFPQNEIVEIER